MGRALGSWSHPFNTQGTQLLQRGLPRRGFLPMGRLGWSTPLTPPHIAQGRQGELSSRLQLEQKTSSGEILQTPPLIAPIPVQTKLQCDSFATPQGMLTNPLAQPLDFFGADRASLNRLPLTHTPIQASAFNIVQTNLRQRNPDEFTPSSFPQM